MTGTEIEITADLVRDLLREQHPDLAGLSIREVAGGWGNQMWRLGDELVVRMQRMDPSAELQLKERRWLPVLAPLEVALDLTFVRDRLPSLLGQGAAMWAD
jgi:aminoglycoside phosphotransferase (APT) family kinase protein